MNNKKSFKDRFKYWFDNQMSKGTSMMILMLVAITLILIIIISVIIQLCGMSEESTWFTSIWDVLSTTINAWMPASEDGGIGYILLTALAAIIGVFFTSFLIGIISTAVEDKLSMLRKGNSKVLEEGHTVLLGFKPGEYELISQLVLAAGVEKRVIVIAETLEKDEMEDDIRDNIEIPKNVKVICRNVNVCDPSALDCCSIPDASVVVINPIDDSKTIKTLLAASHILDETGSDVQIIAAVSDSNYLIPEYTCSKSNILMIQMNKVTARIIAHCCTQPGLSEAFSEVFNFNGNEFYIVPVLPGFVGSCFKDAFLSCDKAVIVGIYKSGKAVLNPPADTVLEDGDSLICFALSKNAIEISDFKPDNEKCGCKVVDRSETLERIVIIGINESFDTLINELPKANCRINITAAGISKEQYEYAKSTVSDRENTIISHCCYDIEQLNALEKLVKNADHIIILSNHELDEEEADMKSSLLLIKLRDIKKRLMLNFTITTEMRREENRSLISTTSTDDFIVSSHMSAMILVQLAETPELYQVFKELLSNEGNEFFLKHADEYGLCEDSYVVSELQTILYKKGYILLGFVIYEDNERKMILNPDITENINLKSSDELIVIG